MQKDVSMPAFDTSYAALPDVLHANVHPYGASKPELIALNAPLAEVLGFDLNAMDDDAQAALFSGNALLDGSQPLAMAYAGHQFGHFNPQLGDGRALLLGEVVGTDGQRYDIQLKGSGQTPFSRQGDGRAALGPVLREYMMSEAMHALGIPTTRALAAVTTGDPVLRDGILPGAMVTRVAASHLRVGTFEFAALHAERSGDTSVLAALVDYALARHDPQREGEETPALKLLTGTIERQASLIAQWMGVGFIHGVMNTDNCTISGQTIDYGPCAFMDTYKRGQVYSSIDHQGRYAFANQGPIAHWNMAVLAQALLPLIGPDEETSIALAQAAVDRFPDLFQQNYMGVMRNKLGLDEADEGDTALVRDLLSLMEEGEADYTHTFNALTSMDSDAFTGLLSHTGQDWWDRWQERLNAQSADKAQAMEKMAAANPVIIPRNHAAEAMTTAGLEGDFAPFHAMVEALATPYTAPAENAHTEPLMRPPQPDEVVAATFCGT